MGDYFVQIRAYDRPSSIDYYIGLLNSERELVGEISDVDLKQVSNRRNIFADMEQLFRLAAGKANKTDVAVANALNAIGVTIEEALSMLRAEEISNDEVPF